MGKHADLKTKAGTLLPLLDLKGKPYLQVAHRLVWFREEHPDWTIMTHAEEITLDHARYRATICTPEGRAIATATKYEDKKGFPDFIEKAETGSVGRALAMCGYGTQFAPELAEGDRLADAPVVPAKMPVVVAHPAAKWEVVGEFVTEPSLVKRIELAATLEELRTLYPHLQADAEKTAYITRRAFFLSQEGGE